MIIATTINITNIIWKSQSILLDTSRGILVEGRLPLIFLFFSLERQEKQEMIDVIRRG